jgi:hypothetical protein
MGTNSSVDFACANVRILGRNGAIEADGLAAGDACAEGDVILCEVVSVGRIGYIEDMGGGEHTLAAGVRFHGVAGFRDSGRSLQGTPPRASVGDIDLLTFGGTVGIANPPPPHHTPVTKLRALGRVTNRGAILNTLGHLADCADARPEQLDAPSVVVLGTSAEVGKTTYVVSLVQAAQRLGLNPYAIKTVGSGRYRDLLTYRKGGATLACDFVDWGLPSTYTDARTYNGFLVKAYRSINSSNADVLIFEVGGDGLSGRFDTFLETLDLARTCFVVIAADVHALVGSISCFGDALTRATWWYAPAYFNNALAFEERTKHVMPSAPARLREPASALQWCLQLPFRRSTF